MPHKPTHSRPPSWSTLFPHPSSTPDTDWHLPKYTPTPTAEETHFPLFHPSRPASPAKAEDRFWSRYGKLLALALAATSLGSIVFSSLVLLRQPAQLSWAREVDPLAELVGTEREPTGPALEDIAGLFYEHEHEQGGEALVTDNKEKEWMGEEEYKQYVRGFLRGEPTESFEDNLLPEYKYITSWPSAGWTNDVMTYANLIHLALLTERIPILPPFAPSHLPLSAGFPSVGEVFDLPRLSHALGIPILEWRDVKSGESEEWDVLGCWSTWSTWHDSPRPSVVLPHLKLDISYTGIPENHKLLPHDPIDPHVSLTKLMQLSFPSARSAALAQHPPTPAPRSGLTLEPGSQLLCYDFLYYTSLDKPYEWWEEWGVQWRMVGREMRWHPHVEQLAKKYLAEHFGKEEGEEIPPYIVVHARRGDFLGQCPSGDTSCLPTLEQMWARVDETRLALQQQRGTRVERVLVTSDELDLGWWEGVREMGYGWMNHTELGTAEKYGQWYGPILDAAFHSLAVGVVGTERSTMSLLGERRAEDWGGAVTRRLRFVDV